MGQTCLYRTCRDIFILGTQYIHTYIHMAHMYVHTWHVYMYTAHEKAYIHMNHTCLNMTQEHVCMSHTCTKEHMPTQAHRDTHIAHEEAYMNTLHMHVDICTCGLCITCFIHIYRQPYLPQTCTCLYSHRHMQADAHVHLHRRVCIDAFRHCVHGFC